MRSRVTARAGFGDVTGRGWLSTRGLKQLVRVCPRDPLPAGPALGSQEAQPGGRAVPCPRACCFLSRRSRIWSGAYSLEKCVCVRACVCCVCVTRTLRPVRGRCWPGARERRRCFWVRETWCLWRDEQAGSVRGQDGFCVFPAPSPAVVSFLPEPPSPKRDRTLERHAEQFHVESQRELQCQQGWSCERFIFCSDLVSEPALSYSRTSQETKNHDQYSQQATCSPRPVPTSPARQPPGEPQQARPLVHRHQPLHDTVYLECTCAVSVQESHQAGGPERVLFQASDEWQVQAELKCPGPLRCRVI